METNSRDDNTLLNKRERGHPGTSDLERQLPVESYHRHLLEWIDGNEVRSLLHHPNETGLGERLHQSCMTLFEYIWTSFSGAPPPLKLGIKASLHQDLSRLYLWGASFQSGWLDMILMESDELRDEVLRLLCDVGLVLTQKMFPLASHGSKFASELQEKVHTLSDLILEAQSVINCHSDEGEYSDSSDFRLRMHEPQGDDYFSSQELTTYTECLMELCETMMRDAVRITSTRIEDAALPTIPFRVSEPADLFVRHVSDKFPKADLNLVQRMGQANWERRERIREQMDVASRTDQVSVDEEPSITQSVFKPTSMFHDSGLGSSIPASIASHRSFASSLASNVNGTLRVPDAPAEVALGKPFKCEYCGHRLLNTRTRVDWKRHVFADLQPYICTEPSCNDLKTFPTRKLWADHEFEKHKIEHFWRCSKCYLEFSNLEDFQSHRRNDHTRITRLLAGTSQATRPTPLDGLKCPLCRDFPVETRKAYETHVGAHLEDVALACLPKDAESDEEEHSVSSNSASSQELPQPKVDTSMKTVPRRSTGTTEAKAKATVAVSGPPLQIEAPVEPSALRGLRSASTEALCAQDDYLPPVTPSTGLPSSPTSIANPYLGLAPTDVQILQQHEKIALNSSSHSQAAAPTPPHEPPRFKQEKAPTPRKERTAAPASIPDTQLGLTSEEVRFLRQHQQIALQDGQSRGRGAGRGSTLGSGAATAASSQGRLILEPTSLQQLGAHFERVMAEIQRRLDDLTEQTQLSPQLKYDRAGDIIDGTDAEIIRLRGILRQIDELEGEFDKIRHIKDIVKRFHSEVTRLEHSLDRREMTPHRPRKMRH